MWPPPFPGGCARFSAAASDLRDSPDWPTTRSRSCFRPPGGPTQPFPAPSRACSAGNLLDWHPRVISLVSWGLFRRDGSFIPVAGTPEPETVARLFQHKVLRMLLEEGAIDEHVVADVLARATRDSEPT